MQTFIVRCTATATIGEAWRVTARSAKAAIDAVSTGKGELLRDWTIGDECDRDDWEAILEADEFDVEIGVTVAQDAAIHLQALTLLEARLATLSGESIVAPTVAKRTPAHERAIRRAWAMRKERNSARQRVRAEMAINVESRERFWREQDKRRRSVMLARDLGKRLNAEHRLVDRANERRRNASHAADEQRRRADAAETALAAIQARANALAPGGAQCQCPVSGGGIGGYHEKSQ